MVYFRVPKTGSTTFVQSCGFWNRVGADHGTYLEESKELLSFQDFKIITLIRNPECWARSFYWMCARVPSHWERWCTVRHKKRPATTEFLRALNVTPLDWVRDEHGTVVADEIYRVEDLPAICEQFGVKPKQPTNKTANRPSCEWTDEDKAIMREKFADEYAFYP